MTGSRAGMRFKPIPIDDPRRRRPDISRARDWLGWAPTTPLDDGLASTIAWFRGRLGVERARRRESRTVEAAARQALA
jgi:nucleoside-diphosphate-sugar epimerase